MRKMQKRLAITIYRAFFGVLTVVTIAIQLAIVADNNPAFSPLNFFSYFTIESNILAAIIFLISAWGAWRNKHSNTFALIRGAAVLYMVTTGIVYSFLLSDVDVQTTGWVNVILHTVMPVAVFADWLFDRPARRIAFKDTMAWLVFPLCFLGYSLIRGALVGWYPYPFLNPQEGGYGRVAATCAAIAVAILGLSWVIARSTQTRRTV